MSHTVGLIGANGRVGRAAAEHLVGAAKAGQIRVVLFHREGSAPKGIDAGANVELRTLDLEKDSKEQIIQAVKGIQVVIATLGFGALPFEPKLAEAIHAGGEAITYIPSVYSTIWSKEEHADPKLGPLLDFQYAGTTRAEELGLGVTRVLTGAFEDFYFAYDFMGSGIKTGHVWANEKQAKHPFPITAIDHLGKVIASTATQDPKSVAGKSFSAVTFWPTGLELQALYSKLTGSSVPLKDYSSADRETLRDDGKNFGPLKAGYLDRWESGVWTYEGDNVTAVPYDGPGIEEVAKRYV